MKQPAMRHPHGPVWALVLTCGCGGRSELYESFGPADGLSIGGVATAGGSTSGGVPGIGGNVGAGGAGETGGTLATGGTVVTGGAATTGGSLATGGSGGFASLIITDREPMGQTCAYGGTRVRTGFDDGIPGGAPGNGRLEPEEIDPGATSYACNDCLRLAVVGGDAAPLRPVGTGIQDALPGVFCEIGLFNADTMDIGLTSLGPYATMVVFNANGFPFDDAVQVGDAVSAYFDDGGQVVVTLFADGGYAITGDWTAKGYNRVTHDWAPIVVDSFDRMNPAQGVLPSHPVLQGVEKLSGQGWIAPIFPTEGSSLVAAYASGTVLAAIGPVKDAQGRLRNRVDLNIHPEDMLDGNWTGDGFRLIANALTYY